MGEDMVRIASVLIYLTLCLFGVNAFSAGQSSVDDYDVTISLYRPSDLAEREIPQPTLAFSNVARPPTGSVRDLLLRIHVWPDSDAIALLYAVNPDLHDPLHLPEQMHFIQIHSTPEIYAALSSGFLFRIHYDNQIVRAIVLARSDLRLVSDRASVLPPDRFDDGPARQTILGCISSISNTLDQIVDALDARDQPTNHEMLLQISGDIELSSQTLERITRSPNSITHPDAASLCAVVKDLKVKQAGFASTRGIELSPWPQALVRVRTVNAQTGKPVSLLTIHFVPEALETLKRWDRVFPTLSSPTEWYLPEADYILWASQNENATPLGRVRISVRKNSGSQPMVVDIPVKQ